MVYRLGVKRDLEVDVEGDRKSLTVVLALGVALAASVLPAWEAYRVSVFELLHSR